MSVYNSSTARGSQLLLLSFTHAILQSRLQCMHALTSKTHSLKRPQERKTLTIEDTKCSELTP